MTANLTVQATATGWHVEGVAPYTSGTFTADLPACDCDPKRKGYKRTTPCEQHLVDSRHGPKVSGGYHREHVETFLRRVAATYHGKTPLPEVPEYAAPAAA